MSKNSSKFNVFTRSQIIVRLLECENAMFGCKPRSTRDLALRELRAELLAELRRKDDALYERWRAGVTYDQGAKTPTP